MKRLCWFGSAGMALLVLAAGCGSAKAPKDTVASFMEASKKGEAGHEDLYATLTEKASKTLRDMEAKGKGAMDDSENLLRYEITSEKIEGDEATVTAQATVKDEDGERTDEMVFVLRQEAGEWKIFKLGPKEFQMNLEDMADMMKGMMEGMMEGMGKALGGEEGKEGAPGAGMEEMMKKALEQMGTEMKAGMEEGLKEMEEEMEEDTPEPPEEE